MAQKILLRRGGIENIGASIATTKGELLFASGSINGVEHVVFISNADGNDAFVPVNRIYTGTANANSFSIKLNGTPYYNTTSQSLHILNNAGSVTPIDLSGNLEGTTISSITATGSFSGSFVGNGAGLTGLTLGSLTAPGTNTQILFNNAGAIGASSNLTVTGTAFDAAALNISTTGNISGSNLKLTGDANISGNINIGGNITVGDADTDFVSFKADISSSIIPDTDSTFDLGSTTKYWKTVYADNFSGSAGSVASVTTLNVTDINATGIISGSTLYVVNNTTINGALAVAGQTNLNGNTVLGNVISDTVAFEASVSSSIIPSAVNIFDIGSSTDVWRTGFFGTGVSSSGYLHAGGNLDVDGTSTLTGDATLGGALTVTGLTTLNGNTILGDANTDTVAFKADVSSSIIPSGNDLFDLGASSDRWRYGYFVSASIQSLSIDGINPTAQDLDDVMNNGNSTNNDFVLNNNGNQSITHTGATGNLSISSTNGNTVIEGTTFAGNDVTIPGNLTVQGTTTTIDSTTVNIGDNIIVLNAAGTVADGGIQVRDTTGTTGTGSLLWNATADYWYAGVSGSTHYRLTTYDNASPAANSIQKVDSNGRLVASTITDNGSLVTVAGDISGSTITASTGFVAAGLTGVVDTSSRVIFRDGSNRLGALATTDSTIEVSTVLGYKADGTLVATSVIDGGTF